MLRPGSCCGEGITQVEKNLVRLSSEVSLFWVIGVVSRFRTLVAASLIAALFSLRSPDPVERFVRDAVLAEKEAQLGRVFLHMAHRVQ